MSSFHQAVAQGAPGVGLAIPRMRAARRPPWTPRLHPEDALPLGQLVQTRPQRQRDSTSGARSVPRRCPNWQPPDSAAVDAPVAVSTPQLPAPVPPGKLSRACAVSSWAAETRDPPTGAHGGQLEQFLHHGLVVRHAHTPEEDGPVLPLVLQAVPWAHRAWVLPPGAGQPEGQHVDAPQHRSLAGRALGSARRAAPAPG